MNRRELLKLSLLSPLLGLVKSRKSGASSELTMEKLLEVRDELLAETTGTPNEGGVWTDEQLHPLGTRRTDSAGRVWTYVQWQGQ